ncbi:MAG: paraquat-inducible protein A [Acetobacteraceae bacterium]|nr:paraquat-inducible protein A [Acetobacteraceae bacterium]
MATLTDTVGVSFPDAAVTPPRLRECHDCGQLQVLPALPPSTRAMCLRCDAVLRHTARDPFGLPLALYLTALLLMGLGTGMTLLSVSTAGQYHLADLFTGPYSLERRGMWILSAVVLLTTFAAPLSRILAMLTVLLALRLKRPPPVIRSLFAWEERLRPWSMIEVYLLGVFVACVRLGAIARIEVGPALYALGALMLVMAAADFALDRQAVWEAMERHHVGRRKRDRSAGTLGANLHRMGCDTCGMVSRAHDGATCPRCGFALRDRKPDSIARTWALGIAAVILYVPANVYPVLTLIRLGAGQPSTILGGARELLDIGEWPLALLVFFASVAVPVLKLVSLTVLLITTQAGYRTRLRDRTVLYRIVDAIGRWSMIDVFMLSVLVALVQFGAVATIQPGLGAVCFAGVVILTMLAARSFDPRLMWDTGTR